MRAEEEPPRLSSRKPRVDCLLAQSCLFAKTLAGLSRDCRQMQSGDQLVSSKMTMGRQLSLPHQVCHVGMEVQVCMFRHMLDDEIVQLFSRKRGRRVCLDVELFD